MMAPSGLAPALRNQYIGAYIQAQAVPMWDLSEYSVASAPQGPMGSGAALIFMEFKTRFQSAFVFAGRCWQLARLRALERTVAVPAKPPLRGGAP